MSSGLWPALAPLSSMVQLVVYDHRGHGRSRGVVPRHEALSKLADDAASLVAELGQRRVRVLGHSNGAFAALHLALRHPQVVERLVLVGGAASGRFRMVAQANAAKRATPRIRRALDRLWGGLTDEDAFRRDWRIVQPLYLARPTRQLVDQIVAPLRFNIESRRRFLPQYDDFDVTAGLAKIRTPTLVIVGRHDWITPPSCASEIARSIPDARLMTFKQSGHYPFLEEPDRFTRVVGAFLSDDETRWKSVSSNRPNGLM